jgi:hypothetical protein
MKNARMRSRRSKNDPRFSCALPLVAGAALELRFIYSKIPVRENIGNPHGILITQIGYTHGLASFNGELY